ncbi:hypothetical protein B0H17DRAFT_1182292 [Mycena rosella]|uniref:Uncharacterized protein n=1 Tax=Mycena rosella TaxID=1033263 RepID=A0AAD7D4P6_MYCRO|nr:hypothetical protein B0H17DRAFT_1182292 [Mycena rosella]
MIDPVASLKSNLRATGFWAMTIPAAGIIAYASPEGEGHTPGISDEVDFSPFCSAAGLTLEWTVIHAISSRNWRMKSGQSLELSDPTCKRCSRAPRPSNELPPHLSFLSQDSDQTMVDREDSFDESVSSSSGNLNISTRRTINCHPRSGGRLSSDG